MSEAVKQKSSAERSEEARKDMHLDSQPAEPSDTNSREVPQLIAAQVAAKLAGRRTRVMHGKTLCSRCLIVPPRPGQRYCRMCKNADDKERRNRNKAALAGVAAALVRGET